MTAHHPALGQTQEPPRRSRLVALVLIAAVGLLLAGCASSQDVEKPVGVGTSPNTLKSSPCGCIELPNQAAA